MTRTVCEETGWRVGDSIIVSGWSGGKAPLLQKSQCNQPDAFPFPVNNPTCPENNENGKVGEAITREAAHSGSQSWHFKRGPSPTSHSQCPYSPELSVQAGRQEEEAHPRADGFYVSLWIKAANTTGDGSSIELALGGPSGSDRVSTMIFVTATTEGLEMKTFDILEGYDSSCVVHANCSVTWDTIVIVDKLDLMSWHNIELTLTNHNTDYGDKWLIQIDGEYTCELGAYLEALILERDGLYNPITRLKMKTRHEKNNADFLGFYFDDIYYKVYNWSNPEKTLDYYETSFEG